MKSRRVFPLYKKRCFICPISDQNNQDPRSPFHGIHDCFYETWTT